MPIIDHAKFPEMTHLLRELDLLRTHNKSTTDQNHLLLFAEGAVVLVALERFLRIILAGTATEAHTLPNLLEMAFSQRRALLNPPGDAGTVVQQIKDVRNTILHGNYEQAARQAGCTSVREYFQKHYTPEVERLADILVHLMEQYFAKEAS